MEYKSEICFLNRHNTDGNEFKLHTHDCYEIVYFLSGTGEGIVGETHYSISANTYCIIPPQTEHTERMEGYGEILFIGFEYKNTDYVLQEGIHQPADTTIHSLFKKIIREYTHQNVGYEIVAKALLDMLLFTSIRETEKVNQRCKDLDYIRAYIDQYFNQKINFRDLAALSGYSYDYFRIMFKNKFDVSPQTYMINKRLSHAKQLLEKSKLSCTEVAYQCGFSNSAQMTMMFKEKFGKTPSAWK